MAQLKRYEGTHPQRGRTEVDSIGRESAIAAALREWGGDWKTEAGQCWAQELGTARKPRCRRCHGEFGQPGDPAAYCPACEEILARQRREAERYAAGAKARERRLREMEEG